MTPPPLFHALLRPAVLQILRATGYHGAKISVLDSVTDLAARYFFHLCKLTALYAAHNNDDPLPTDEIPINGSSSNGSSTVNPAVPAPTLVDVRMALQRAGALLPDRIAEEQEYLGGEDLRGVEAFVAWATGPLNREITRIALDGNDEAADYLDALKKKHSKNDDDSKYLGTLLGRSIEHGDVLVEGGECPSISVWEDRRRAAGQQKKRKRSPEPPALRKGKGDDGQSQRVNGAAGIDDADGDVDGDGDGDGNGEGDGDGEDSRPGSSGLSSLGDRSIADEMDLS